MKVDNEDRLRYYLGRAHKKKIRIHTDKRYLQKIIAASKWETIQRTETPVFLTNYNNLLKYERSTKSRSVVIDNFEIAYINPLIKLFNTLSLPYRDCNFIYEMGDKSDKSKVQLLAKCRRKTDDNTTLLKLDSEWHYGPVGDVKVNDISFFEKEDKVVWRSASHNRTWWRKAYRYDLVNKYYNADPIFNIGFTKNYNDHDHSHLLKPYMTMAEQLRYKFIISVEGNDIASGLRWQMYSNSVVLMPKPVMCSWFMESTLVPYVHYVPLKNNFSDLNKKFKWCLDNLDTCHQISRNATQYVEQFLNNRNEMLLQRSVLKRFLDNVEVVI